MPRPLSRRLFLEQAGMALSCRLLPLTGVLFSPGQVIADTAGVAPGFNTLGPLEVAGFEAVAARILPSDDSPGAVEGGVIHFIDQVLGESRQEWLLPLQAGLADLDARALASHGAATFAALDPLQQDVLLHEIEKTPFFNTMRTLTLAGMFALPEYGGNRDYSGWHLIGFDHRHAWQPPFGYYDADYLKRGN